MIYLDSSALMKLIRREHETEALREWLELRPDQPAVSSEVGRVEVLRAARRLGGPALTEARAVLGDLDLVPLDRVVLDVACDLGDPVLRTVDALHVASALLLGDGLTALMTYDHRLAEAARAAGLVVATPGQDPPPEGRLSGVVTPRRRSCLHGIDQRDSLRVLLVVLHWPGG